MLNVNHSNIGTPLKHIIGHFEVQWSCRFHIFTGACQLHIVLKIKVRVWLFGDHKNTLGQKCEFCSKIRFWWILLKTLIWIFVLKLCRSDIWIFAPKIKIILSTVTALPIFARKKLGKPKNNFRRENSNMRHFFMILRHCDKMTYEKSQKLFCFSASLNLDTKVLTIKSVIIVISFFSGWWRLVVYMIQRLFPFLVTLW